MKAAVCQVTLVPSLLQFFFLYIRLIFPRFPTILTEAVDFQTRRGGSEAVLGFQFFLIAWFQIDIDGENAVAAQADRMVGRCVVGVFITGEPIGHGGGAD